MIKLTGLWLHKDKNGNDYFSGPLGNSEIKVFKNTYKKEENHPDFILYVDEQKKKETKPADEAPF